MFMKLIKNIFLLILIYSSIFSQGLSETINKKKTYIKNGYKK